MSAIRRISPQTHAHVLRLAIESAQARLAMKGESMLPDVREGMTLEVIDRAPRRGDILVFRYGSRLLAHRVVGFAGESVVCAGDAQPEYVERVHRRDIVGVVDVITDASGKRIDTALFRIRGLLRARLHRARALLNVTLPQTRRRMYRTLVRVMTAVVRADSQSLAHAIQSEPLPSIAAMARRQRCAAALCAALEELRDDANAAALRAMLRRDRWIASLRLQPLRAQTLEVLDVMESSGISAVLLKGAQRALSGTPESLIYESRDIDVLVGTGNLDDACRALQAAGYRQIGEAGAYARHHHAAPFLRAGALPVEVHHALFPDPLGVPNTLAELQPFVHEISVDGRPIRVLNDVGTALHLAVHCVHRPALREIVLLAQQIGRMDVHERKWLRATIELERRYAAALHAPLFLAAQIAGIEWSCDARAQRFATWMLLREDLPRPLRERTFCIDAWLASAESPVMDALRASYSDLRGGRVRTGLRAMLKIVSALATPLYASLMRR